MCAPNMVSFVYYLVTLKSLFVMPMKFFGGERGINGCLFECESGAVAGLEREEEGLVLCEEWNGVGEYPED